MKRILLVLAVTAMMVVMVFAAPAFADAPSLPDASEPAGPPWTETSGPPGVEDVDPKAPAGTIGNLASEIVVDDATLHGVAPGHHILDDIGYTPGECVQNPLPCLERIGSH